MTVWAVNATTPPAPVSAIAQLSNQSPARATGTRTLFDPALAVPVQAAVLQRGEMAPGQHITGPAVITEDETTIVVPSSRQAIAQTDGCIDVTAISGEERS